MKIIAHINTDFPEKFGIPRQSNLAKSLKGTVIFEPEFRDFHAVQGLEEFNYIWILWQFEGTERSVFSPMVRPPRLGGNTEKGVFATRSPFRPNAIGLSSVKLEGIEYDSEKGPLLHVSGIDMRDHTPIYDIKPYLKYVDCHEDALDGFAAVEKDTLLEVCISPALIEKIPKNKRAGLVEFLAQDPRPAYHHDPVREYGAVYAQRNIKFRVDEGKVIVTEIQCFDQSMKEGVRYGFSGKK